MNTRVAAVLGVLIAASAAAGGYWWGQRPSSTAPSAATPVSAHDGAAPKRRILYYRNPMGLPDRSPTPKKDSMGMNYVPVYEGEGDEGGGTQPANAIRISTEKVQKLGVRTDAVVRRQIDRVIRAAGRIAPDERRTFAISPKFEGYVERLYVNVTGQPVAKGEALFDVYSPDMVAAQGEYLVAAKALAAIKDDGGAARRDMQSIVDASLLRLKNWDIPDDQIRALTDSGSARRTLTIRSPVTGVVTEKKALQGMRFGAGDTLYQVTDLSHVWVVADVFEQDIGAVKVGGKARIKLAAYPERTFAGTITYIYPTLNAETRTVPVRIELPNPGQLLKPAMFAQVELPVPSGAAARVVPTSAVIDSGMRRVVLVQSGEGRFEPREVRTGQRGEEFVEILDGVVEGERVVVAANFLIDAESNLKAAISGFNPESQAGRAASASEEGQQMGPVGHAGRGRIEQIDAQAGTVSIGHGPIEALKMPAMTMDFRVANASLLEHLKAGMTVDFEFVERRPGEWVITRIEPADDAPAPAMAHEHAQH